MYRVSFNTILSAPCSQSLLFQFDFKSICYLHDLHIQINWFRFDEFLQMYRICFPYHIFSWPGQMLTLLLTQNEMSLLWSWLFLRSYRSNWIDWFYIFACLVSVLLTHSDYNISPWMSFRSQCDSFTSLGLSTVPFIRIMESCGISVWADIVSMTNESIEINSVHLNQNNKLWSNFDGSDKLQKMDELTGAFQ